MAIFFTLLLICLVAATGIAAAINFFLRTGPWAAFGYGLFAVAIFLLFWASGLWEDAGRHDWGSLAPVFALMLIGGALSLKFGRKAWEWWKKQQK